MSSLYILWDESHIWGLLAWRAIKSLGLPYEIVRADEIAQGLLNSKPCNVLVAPGGVARRKAEKLGQVGMEAIRQYIAKGGAYVGFCGGSGLGLTSEHGLNICPWRRAKMRDRMQHLVSGHLQVKVPNDHPLIPDALPERPLLPVWWPARFGMESNPDVEILASYEQPGPDFWLADLPLDLLPKGTFSDWEQKYGVRLKPTSMMGQPCVVKGVYGKGSYVLSYAHLETPDSPDANLLLSHILCTLAGDTAASAATCTAPTSTPPWHLSKMDVRWTHPMLARARAMLDEIITLGQDHFLLFTRNPWLMGWRAGIPGSHLNHLYSLLCQAQNLAPTEEAQAYANKHRKAFEQATDAFGKAATGYLLAERLTITLTKTFPDMVSQERLLEQRTTLFGPPMEQGGLYAQLLHVLDELVWLLLK